jgi:hypothetical protein
MADVQIGIQTGFQPQGTEAAQKALANVGTQASKAEKELLAYANAQARLARATGDNQGAANIYAQALSQVNRNSREGVQAQAQLQQAVNRVNTGFSGGQNYIKQFGSEVVGQLGSMIGPAAAATAALAAVSEGIKAGQAALSLRETQNTLRALSGDTQTYNKIVQTAAQQQLLFGGTLEENIRGLQGLVITSRSTGAALDQLINLSQRLAVLDPAQGAEGARIALSEVLSGDPRSLSRRYEIPLSALEKIKDESIPVGERLQVLDQYLSKIGITAESVGARVDPTAQKFRDLGAAADVARVSIGGFLADGAAPFADTLTNLLGVFQGGEQGFTDFAIGAMNAQRALVGLPPLTQAMEEGVRGQAAAVLNLNGIQDESNGLIMQSADAADRAALASGNLTTAVNKELNEKIEGQIQTDALARLQAQLEADSMRAAMGLLGSGDQALVLAEKYGIAQAAAQDLILAKQRLSNAEALADQRKGEQTGTRLTAREFQNFSQLRRQGEIEEAEAAKAAAEKATREREKAAADAKRIADAQFEYELSTATDTAGEIAMYKKRLAGTTDQEERLRLQTQINNLQQRQEKADERAAKKALTVKNPQLKGLDALQQDRIDLAGTEQQQLAEVNRQLAAGNLTEHQRNTLKEKQLQLEKSINEEIFDRQRAAANAELKSVQDAQARLKEARQATGLQRAISGGRLTPEQEQAALLKLREISAQQAVRSLDVQEEQRKAGVPVSAAGVPVAGAPGVGSIGAAPNPFVAPQAASGAFSPAVAAAPVTVNITLNVDSAGRVSAQSGPGVLLNLLGSAAGQRNLTGGAF